MADVIFGKVNPAGRTTQTWVADILDLPHIMDYDITHGYTYMYNRNKPLFPFGYGLSYTDFEYSGLKTKINDGILNVRFTITNTGELDGEEVSQLYISIPDKNTPYRLKAFDRVAITRGADKEVSFDVALTDIGNWNESEKNFMPKAGSKLKLAVGASSADIRLSKDISL